MKRAFVHLLAAAAGMASWIAASYFDGQPEAWDGMLYREMFLPALVITLVVLGFWLRERVGALGVAASFGQMSGLLLTPRAGRHVARRHRYLLRIGAAICRRRSCRRHVAGRLWRSGGGRAPHDAAVPPRQIRRCLTVK